VASINNLTVAFPSVPEEMKECRLKLVVTSTFPEKTTFEKGVLLLVLRVTSPIVEILNLHESASACQSLITSPGIKRPKFLRSVINL